MSAELFLRYGNNGRNWNEPQLAASTFGLFRVVLAASKLITPRHAITASGMERGV